MVTLQQVQKGFARYVDTNIATAFEGWQRTIVAGFAALIAANLPNLIASYAEHPLFAALGIYNKTSDMVAIDAVYNAFVPNMGSDKIPISIPKIGTIKMGKEEFDTLLRYIKEA
jgi:hypothetical protein